MFINGCSISDVVMDLDKASLDDLLYEYATLTHIPVTTMILHTQDCLSMGHSEEKVKETYKVLIRREYRVRYYDAEK